MRFPPLWRKHASGASRRDPLGSLRKALDRAGVDYSPANPLAALAQLPVSDAPVDVPPAPPQEFESPLPGVAPNAPAPDVLVLPLNAALELALGSAGTASAIVVVTSVADAPLADHHRDLLWRSLGLPVFEQLTAWDGAVIARECEIHDGLHVAAEVIAQVERGELILTQIRDGASVLRARTGLAAEMTAAVCECGRETPRLKSLTALEKWQTKAPGSRGRITPKL